MKASRPGTIRIFFKVILCMLLFANALRAQVTGDSSKVTELLRQMSHYDVRDPDKAIALGDSALQLAHAINDSVGIINATYRLAWQEIYQSRQVKAREMLSEVLGIARKMNRKKGIGSVKNALGMTYLDEGNYVVALPLFQEAQQIFAELGLAEGEAVTENNIAIIHGRLGDHPSALKHYRRALEIHEERREKGRQFAALVNIGLIYLDDYNMPDSALIYHQRAYDIAQEIKDPRKIALANSSMVDIWRKKREFAKARACADSALETFEKLGNRFRIATVKLKLGTLAKHQGRPAQALAYYDEAMPIANEIDAVEIRKSLYFHYSKAHKDLGQHQKALRYYELYTDLNDSLRDLGLQRQTETLRQHYQADRKEQQLAEVRMQLKEEKLTKEQQQIDLEKKELELSRGTMRMWLLFGIAAILATVAGFLVMKNRDNRRHARLLREKQELTERALREKEILLGEVHHRVKNNLQLVYNMLDLQARSIADEASLKAIRDSRDRVLSMALVHQRLYEQEQVGGVSMPDYIRQLLEGIRQAYSSAEVQLESDVDPLVLDIDTVVPVGLVINELVTNAYKYAFPEGRSGTLRVGLRDEGERVLLTVADDGVGMPAENAEGRGSFGMQLVRSLARQLKAEIDVSGTDGTCIALGIRKFKRMNV